MAAAEPAAAHGRRTFLVRAALVGGAAVVVAGAGRVLGTGRRAVEETRRLLRIEGAGQTPPPRGSSLGVDDIASWQTPNDDFYQIHTALVVPAIAPVDWRLRIHGMVEREIELTYDALLARERTEAWVTLNCVSNPVGGDLVGNALWTGVLTSELLAEAGVLPGADAVLQTSEDGWTCGTPLEALTDARGAMLAVAMNGEALPIEHGFPVRTLVPGLYGYVSATKWVVDLEVTRFADFSAYWTQRGWGERGPVKIASRIDVPRSGEDVPAGRVAFGGVAWMQGTGIAAVEFSVDGGEWVRRRPGPGAQRRHLGAVGRHHRGRARRPPGAGARHRRRRQPCRPTSSATCCPTAPPASTRSTSARPTPRRPTSSRRAPVATAAGYQLECFSGEGSGWSASVMTYAVPPERGSHAFSSWPRS